MSILIKKLLGRHTQKSKLKNEYFYLKDIYFVIDFKNQEIIPIVFNQNYTSLQRLDNMEVIKHSGVKSKLDNFDNVPSFLIKVSNSANYEIIYNRNYYQINYMTIKMLFADLSESFSALNDIQILNVLDFDSKYNLIRKFTSIRNHLSKPINVITSNAELEKMIKYVKNSKSFKHEVEEFQNMKSTEKSRTF